MEWDFQVMPRIPSLLNGKTTLLSTIGLFQKKKTNGGG